MRYQTLIPLAVLPAAFGQLNKLAKAKGFKYFGTATDNPELTDSAYKAILSNNSEWGQLTVGNTQKWEYVEPTQDVYSYTQGDVIVSLAEANDQLVRCHNLVWYNQLPDWVTSGTWTNATLIAALKAHITNEVTHYKGKCYCWDVVNEALNDDGTYRADVFYNTIGPEYIPIAFEAAAAADPNVKLYYNDYNIESAGSKSTAAQAIVKSLKARGIKIDGVGLQAHFIVGETPSKSSQLTNLQAFTALGVEVAYTELDVRFLTLPPTAAGLTQQTTDYVNTVGACLSLIPSCVGVTVWDFDDAYSWIPGTFSGEGDADLFYANLTRTPAYYGIVSLLGGAASVTSTALSTKTTSTTSSKPTSSKSTSASATTTTGTSACTVAHWNQCGGLTYTGCTVCASGYTCTYSSNYYSQCL